MLRFIDDLGGAIMDFIKSILGLLGYFLAGFIIVAVFMYILMYLIVWGFG